MINLGNPPRPTSGLGSVSVQNLNDRIKALEETLAPIVVNTNPLPANAAGVLANNGTGTLSWVAQTGLGTVTAVTIAAANGITGTTALQGTTPQLTVILGAIAPASVTAAGAVVGSNLSGTNTGDQTNITGNAATVTTNANLIGPVTSLGNVTSIATGAISSAMVTSILTSKSVNGVTLTTGGLATTYLNAAGAYTTPPDLGTVTNVSVLTSAGVSGTVTNPTTTPAITVVLGAITPTSVAAVGAVTGSNLSGTNTGDSGTVTSVSVTTANGVSGSVATATSTPAITLTLGAITPSSVASTGAISGTTGAFTGVVTVPAGTAAAPAIVSTTGTADTGPFYLADIYAIATAGVERMRVGPTGLVGVGVTPTGATMEIASTLGAGTDQLRLTPAAAQSTQLALYDGGGSASARSWGFSTNNAAWGSFGLFESASQGANPFSGTARITVLGGGSVGIGTTAPTSLFHVLGSQPAAVATSGTAGTQVIQITGGKGGNTTGVTAQVGGAGALLNLTAGAGGDAPAGSTNGTGGTITLQGGAAGAGLGAAGAYGNLLMQTGGGNVGIGTTAPGALLHVNATSAPVIRFENATITSTSAVEFRTSTTLDGSVGYQASSGKLTISSGRSVAWGGHIVFETDTAEKMRIDSTGNVGIGTTTPGAKLYVLSGSYNVPSGTAVAMVAGGGTSPTSVNATIVASSNDAMAINTGASIGFSGRYITASDGTWVFGTIGAFKETSGNGVPSGYLTLSTTNGAGSVVEQMRINSTGNVGIGKTPGAKLDVAGQTRIGADTSGITTNSDLGGVTEIANDNTFYVAQTSGAGTALFDKIVNATTDGAGLIGRRARGTPSALIDVVNGDQIGHVDFRSYSGTKFFQQVSVAAYVDGPFTSGQAPPSRLMFATNAANEGSTERMSISNTGGVTMTSTGGGVISLAINATVATQVLTSTTGTNVTFTDYVNTGGTLRVGRERSSGGGLLAGTSAYDGVITMQSAHSLHFGTNSAVAMTILSGGNVGIGTTAPGAKLTVFDSINGEVAIHLKNTSTGVGAYGAVIAAADTAVSYLYTYSSLHATRPNLGNVGTVTAHDFSINTGDQSKIYIKHSTGNVGIGTTAPGTKLDVVGNSRFTVDNEAYATALNATTGNIRIYPYLAAYGGSNLTAFGAGYAGYGPLSVDCSIFDIWTAATRRARVDGSGNVAIGANTPVVKLDVDGPIRCKSYTVATVPAAATAAGQLIYVTDAAVGATHCSSNGTLWKITGTQTTLT